MNPAIRILSTKKLLPQQRQYLLNAGFSVLQADFITVVPTEFETANVKQNLIFTSGNAVAAVAAKDISLLRGSRVFCVGEKTRATALRLGAEVIITTDYGEDLAKRIVQDYSAEAFTFFSGNLRRDVLPDMLQEKDISFNEVEVYKTELTPQRITAALNGILFFSPSGVESFLRENNVGEATCFCIGNTTAQALSGITERVVVANKPSVENVIIQCINYYKQT